MERLLDIVVPHYHEEWDIVRPFFDVLKSQKGVDFTQFKIFVIHNGVVSVNSSLYEPYRKEENFIPLQVEHIYLKEKGVSRARNCGIDLAGAKWIAFCDCDDCYTSIFSLMKIFHILSDPEAERFNLIWGSFYMQGIGKLAICNKFDTVFIHNKYYQTVWLKRNKYRFNESIYMSEDSAFNTVIKMDLPMKYIGQINSDEPLYAWCRRPGSITMDFSKWLSNTEGHFERNLYILSEHRKRNSSGTDRMVARTLTDAYAMLNKRGIQGDKERVLKRVRAFYSQYAPEYGRVSKEDIRACLDASDRDACIDARDKAERPTFEEWMESLKA